jgi:enterochelin esterase-like enzyme
MLSDPWRPPTGAPARPPHIPRPAPVERATSPRIAALSAVPGKAADFWRTAETEGTPLIEPADGDPGHAIVTFLWRGTKATRAVLVLPNELADPHDLSGNLMDRVPGTDIWHWSVRMRTDWRATYTLCVDDGQRQGARQGPSPDYHQWLSTQHRRDPFNPGAFPRRWGGEPLSVVALPDAPGHPSDWEPHNGIPRGEVSVHTMRSANLRNWRRVWVYTPAGYEDLADLPVLVLLDGEMWQPELGISNLLDNLIADGRLPPLVALLPDSLDSDVRWDELTCDSRFTNYLLRELLPWAARRWPLTNDPARTVLAGQGLGGLTAAHAALRSPTRFGNALVQSGSFWWPAGPGAEWLTGRVERSSRRPVRFRISAGLQEWVLLPASRRLRDALRARGYDVDYRELNAGHDYLPWRDELAAGLVHLLGR